MDDDYQEDLENITISAVMSVPRYGSNAARGVIEEALFEFGIPLHTSQGVYWGKCQLQRMAKLIEKGNDWLLAIDFDSLFLAEHLRRLIGIFGANKHMDALAPMQVKRDGRNPLFSLLKQNPGETVQLKTDRQTPFPVYTGHFGCTLLRAAAFENVEQPWFLDIPPEDVSKSKDPGAWIDADIEFWRRWHKASNSLWIDPGTRIGHLVEDCLIHDINFQPVRISIDEWQRDPIVRGQSHRRDAEDTGTETTEESTEESSDECSEEHCVAGCGKGVATE